MNMWKEAGITVIPVIPNVKIAKKMEAIGADAINGDIENGSVMTGQISGIINKITSVEKL